MEKTSELDLGKITIGLNDHDEYVKAFQVIAEHDAEMFAQMREKEWNIASCTEKPAVCVEMLFTNAMGWSPPLAARKILGNIHTYISMDMLRAEANFGEFDFTELLATTLAHEFVHLFQGIGERNPIECSLELAEKIGDRKLVDYLNKMLKHVTADNEWDVA